MPTAKRSLPSLVTLKKTAGKNFAHFVAAMSGGVVYKKVTEDSYQITAADCFLSVNCGSSNWEIFLPATASVGKMIYIKPFNHLCVGDITIYGLINSISQGDITELAFGGLARFVFNGERWELLGES